MDPAGLSILFLHTEGGWLVLYNTVILHRKVLRATPPPQMISHETTPPLDPYSSFSCDVERHLLILLCFVVIVSEVCHWTSKARWNVKPFDDVANPPSRIAFHTPPGPALGHDLGQD